MWQRGWFSKIRSQFVCTCMCVCASCWCACVFTYIQACIHVCVCVCACTCACAYACARMQKIQSLGHVLVWKLILVFQLSLYDEAVPFGTIKVWYRCPYIYVSWLTGFTPADQWVDPMLWYLNIYSWTPNTYDLIIGITFAICWKVLEWISCKFSN